jgi:uncharacterized membrane protein
MPDAPGLEQNVIAVSFQDDSNAYDAMTRLKELDSQGQLELDGAAVVVRAEDGHVEEKDEVDDAHLPNTAAGGLIGLVVGIIGGPLGILLGGATGVFVGSLFDLHDSDETLSALEALSKSAQVGRNLLLAEVAEQSPEVVDTAMQRLGGTVLRRGLFEVEAEVAAAEKAQRKAQKEARKELRKAHHDQHRNEIHEKIEELKAKLRELNAKLPGHKQARAPAS